MMATGAGNRTRILAVSGQQFWQQIAPERTALEGDARRRRERCRVEQGRSARPPEPSQTPRGKLQIRWSGVRIPSGRLALAAGLRRLGEIVAATIFCNLSHHSRAASGESTTSAWSQTRRARSRDCQRTPRPPEPASPSGFHRRRRGGVAATIGSRADRFVCDNLAGPIAARGSVGLTRWRGRPMICGLVDGQGDGSGGQVCGGRVGRSWGIGGS